MMVMIMMDFGWSYSCDHMHCIILIILIITLFGYPFVFGCFKLLPWFVSSLLAVCLAYDGLRIPIYNLFEFKYSSLLLWKCCEERVEAQSIGDINDQSRACIGRKHKNRWRIQRTKMNDMYKMVVTSRDNRPATTSSTYLMKCSYKTLLTHSAKLGVK